MDAAQRWQRRAPAGATAAPALAGRRRLALLAALLMDAARWPQHLLWGNAVLAGYSRPVRAGAPAPRAPGPLWG
eukprot:11192907-Lingulodinium_polyedra.AAC.1